jgi:hypothetical protein
VWAGVDSACLHRAQAQVGAGKTRSQKNACAKRAADSHTACPPEGHRDDVSLSKGQAHPLSVNEYQKKYEEQQIKYMKKKAAKFGYQLIPT